MTGLEYIRALRNLVEVNGDLEVWQSGSESSPSLANPPEIGYVHKARYGLDIIDPKDKNQRVNPSDAKVIHIPGLGIG